MPADTNPAGIIFGGWIMSQVDIAGGIEAARHARGKMVTVAVDSFEFHAPVYVGDIVSFYAEIKSIGHTSVTVNVEVYAERRPERMEVINVTRATLTYVHVDDDRRPQPLPADLDRRLR